MMLNDYQADALRTAKHREPCREGLTYGALKLAGEAGEVADLVGKTYTDKPLDREAAIEELGDVLWYVAFVAHQLGASLDEVAARNVLKLAARHGVEYDPSFYSQPVPV